MFKAPLHSEVADALKAAGYPEIGDMIRSGEQFCWGDHLLEAQRKWSPTVVAGAIQAIVDAGWGECVRIAWCPLTPELDRVYMEALERFGPPGKADATRTILGAIVTRVRSVWQRTRRQWCEDWCADDEHGETMLSMIQMYLHNKEANSCGR